MNMSFSFIVFQPNPMRDRVVFWVEGKKEKRSMKRDDFMNLTDSPSLSTALYDACSTYAFYLWDNINEKITILKKKNDPVENGKGEIKGEFSKFRNNPQYKTPTKEERKNALFKNDLALLDFLGLESTSMENIKILASSLSDIKSGGFFDFLTKR